MTSMNMFKLSGLSECFGMFFVARTNPKSFGDLRTSTKPVQEPRKYPASTKEQVQTKRLRIRHAGMPTDSN